MVQICVQPSQIAMEWRSDGVITLSLLHSGSERVVAKIFGVVMEWKSGDWRVEQRVPLLHSLSARVAKEWKNGKRSGRVKSGSGNYSLSLSTPTLLSISIQSCPSLPSPWFWRAAYLKRENKHCVTAFKRKRVCTSPWPSVRHIYAQYP